MIKTFILFFFLISSGLKAETTQVIPPEEKFAGIIQFSKDNAEYDFKDIIEFGKAINVPKNSYIKIITQKRCIAVLYENTKVEAPADRVSPWKVVSGDVRWICPEDKVERLLIKDLEVQVQNGELLLTGSQLLVIKNSVRIKEKDLNSNSVYIYKNKKFLLLKNQPDPYDIWTKQQKFPAPLESLSVKVEKPQDPYVNRVFLTVAPVGFAGLYHHEEENKVSNFEMGSHAFRLGVNFPWKNKSIYTFLEYNQGDSTEKNNNNQPIPVGTKSLKFEATTLGLGLRHNHINSSSFYYYVGLTNQKVIFHLRPETNKFLDGKLKYNYNVTIGGGYQKIFWPKNWVSLVIGFDLKVIQSLDQGEIVFLNQSFNEDIDPRSAITEYAGVFYLGPTFNF